MRRYLVVRRELVWAAPFAVIALSACIGAIGDAGGGGPGAGGLPAGSDAGDSATTSSCTGTPSPGEAPLRRLTQSEYNHTVRDLLGDTTNPASAFPADQKIGDFTNTAVALTVPPLLAQAYEAAAEQLAATAVKSPTLLPCDPTTAGEDACAASFIDAFGKRAYRRPLTADEKTALSTLYTTNKTGADFTNGITAVIEGILQSAPFLYRPELGDSSQAQGPAIPLTSYEMASRLSYLVWGSMPDDTLFAEADAGRLTTAAELATQARRMLADPKAHPAVDQFFTEWLTLDQVVQAPKDPKTYPEFTASLATEVTQETQAFVDWVMWQSDARIETLLTSPVTFVNADLATVYGIPGVTGSALQQVTLDGKQRAGLLTQPSLMAVLGKADRSSPVLRGKFVRERMLCQPVPPPPPNLGITPPPVTPGVTTRQMFASHDTVEPCKSCHILMDPIGFGFESYDGIGRFRTTDQSQPVDATGTLSNSDVDGAFDGAIELANLLAKSQEVGDCVATEWFRYGFGRGESTADTCSLETIKQTFTSQHFDMKELIVAITQTDAFRFRTAVTP